MSTKLDRPGIFKARPFSWEVQKAESGAVAVSIGFEIVSKLDENNQWDQYDWSGYHCYGSWWVVKKDGSVNQQAVEQLAMCLGWSGNLADIAAAAPEIVVQITVEEDTYKNRTRYKASWMNPEDYVPSDYGASDEEVQQLQARFGSLLRAAAAGASAAAPAGAPPPGELPPVTDDDIPF